MEENGIIEIIEDRIKAYYTWLQGGCVGPDPCGKCVNPPYTYGDPRLKRPWLNETQKAP